MNKWLSSLLKSKQSKNTNGEYLPWLDTPSIYDHILRHIDPAIGKLTGEVYTLPDDERRFLDEPFRWVPGAMEGVFGGGLPPEQADDVARQISYHIKEITEKNALESKVWLYKFLLKDELADYIDTALEAIVNSGIRPTQFLSDFARFIAKTAPDRGPVKFAIALLGLLHDPIDVSLVSTLGLHEEFTLYSAVAIANILDEPDMALWDLARKVGGWGRVQTVKRLISTNSPEIKSWLLLEGFRNNVMYEYLALDCAVAGDLKAALAVPNIEDDLLLASGEILEALTNPFGPGNSFREYADSVDVVFRYLELIDERGDRVDQYLVVLSLERYLSWQRKTDADYGIGWNSENRSKAVDLARHILEKPHWPGLVIKALDSPDDEIFYPAAEAARSLGIDPWPYHWARLNQNLFDSGCWFQVMNHANPERIDRILDLAIKTLPLDQIATGPAADAFPATPAGKCIIFILQELKKYPGKGWPLIAAGLKSPVVNQRHQALHALEALGKENWNQEIRDALQQAYQIEPVDAVRDRLKELLGEEDL